MLRECRPYAQSECEAGRPRPDARADRRRQCPSRRAGAAHRDSGPAFCSGFNIGKVGSSDAGERFEALANALEAARPVTIALIQGGLYGGATDLALACDFRLGAHGVDMFMPAARLGLLFYRGGLERYVSRLGLATAKRVLLAVDKLDAAQMLACGFLDRVAGDPDALQTQAAELSESWPA
ncbi:MULTISPECIES: enoyl-CoA hydratase/isomerase family protein [Cupriavidus]|uniref:Enoyl-CoA hydratase/carnithine racemase n=1 Tax=Cupriavidus necator (strain ATCC 17699 / DSM 428 / KCTC 22496 / NCIMB 10442 / H16 / Stanier 337) TaxID=381666 RepID=Q0KAN6_CUPNH|nr:MULTISPECIES: enoyl-CoA hydratase/isomerase family protein [Cupriavidus]WKA42674.1 enoyl-CoA hydratase/isomerase family protein [Cupriavidus necator]CAJ92935.1 Enoyl-CoA hydratase/carnithine racemase [Cupriavidus necator H16]